MCYENKDFFIKYEANKLDKNNRDGYINNIKVKLLKYMLTIFLIKQQCMPLKH